jgi:hypothetical protein
LIAIVFSLISCKNLYEFFKVLKTPIKPIHKITTTIANSINVKAFFISRISGFKTGSQDLRSEEVLKRSEEIAG